MCRQAEKLELEDDANKENEVFGSTGNMGRYGVKGINGVVRSGSESSHPSVYGLINDVQDTHIPLMGQSLPAFPPYL